MKDPVTPLFKYVPPERADILEEECIAFTPPLRFNDPFDLHPTVAHITDRRYLRRAAIETEWQMPIPKSLPASRKSKREMLRSIRREVVKAMRAQAEPFAARVQSTMLSQFNERGGVLCLTSLKDSLLMWAHYAASHRGFVIEFNSEEPAFRDLGKVWRITYSRDRPVADTTKRPQLEWFFVKGKEWEYESEFRIIREFRHCQAVEKNGQVIHVYPLPKQAIKAIYLGVNMQQPARQRVLAALRGTHIETFQAQLPRKTFGLEFQKL